VFLYCAGACKKEMQRGQLQGRKGACGGAFTTSLTRWRVLRSLVRVWVKYWSLGAL
jgi:hypothetical protein